MTELAPNYRDVQAHYDLSDEFFALFLDESLTYSCAYFERDDMTLAEAQRAKVDLSLGKCDLRPGLKLLDVGCGWGATARRAAEKHGVHAIGLTLSKNQWAAANERARRDPPRQGSVEYRLQGWEEFHEPVDRVVSIGAFEHFRKDRYDAFFARCRDLLPADGRMMLHTIVWHGPAELARRGIPLTHENVLFGKFIRKHIFPGGQLPAPEEMILRAELAGFVAERVQSLRLHYARTLDCWAANLSARQDEAIALQSAEVYDIYMKYLTGCAAHFRSGHIDVMQFTLVKPFTPPRAAK